MIAAVTAAALVASPSGAAETLRYRIHQQFDQVLDLSAVGQAEQITSVGFEVFVTLLVTDSADGKAVQAVIDSVVPGTGADHPAMSVMIDPFTDLRGAGFVTADREAEGFADVDSARGPQLRALVAGLFPKVRPGTKAGDSWSDTVSTTDTVPTGISTRNAVTSYVAAAGESGALKVTSRSAYSVSGTAEGGAPLEGRGNSTTEMHVAQEGWIVKSTSDTQMDLLVLPQGMGPIPVSNQIVSTIALLP